MQGLQIQYHPQHYSSKCPNPCIAAFLLGINIFKITYLESSLSDSCLLSPFLRSCRAARASAMWWLSAHSGRRAGCRLPSRPRTPRDTSSRMRASLRSPLTKSKSGFTTTREKALLVQWPPSTQRRKVCTVTAVQQSMCSLNSGNVQHLDYASQYRSDSILGVGLQIYFPDISQFFVPNLFDWFFKSYKALRK